MKTVTFLTVLLLISKCKYPCSGPDNISKRSWFTPTHLIEMCLSDKGEELPSIT